MYDELLKFVRAVLDDENGIGEKAWKALWELRLTTGSEGDEPEEHFHKELVELMNHVYVMGGRFYLGKDD